MIKTDNDRITYHYATDLKKHYSVLGHFYILDLGKEGKHKCRSVVEIVAKDERDDIHRSIPDAIAIMMNPGSSRPMQEEPTIVYNSHNIGDIDNVLVDAKPDATQYQIMRLMAHFGWEHVRIINLSDLRTGNSSHFESLLKNINSDLHSIFSLKRRTELKRKMPRKEHAPIICAWGLDSHLLSLADKAKEYLKNEIIIGLPKDDGSFLFRHAKPSLQAFQEKWLSGVAHQIKEKLYSTISSNK